MKKVMKNKKQSSSKLLIIISNVVNGFGLIITVISWFMK